MFKRENDVFAHPFKKRYWILAAREFKSIQMIAIAALFIAMRIAVKTLSIDIAYNLKFSLDFLVNSVGSMIYGPLMGLAVGAASDTLGFIIKPSGTYFLPFILVEMSSSFIFALFLYRSKLTPNRIILSRFSVTLFCNLLLTPAIIKLQTIMTGGAYSFFTLPRLLKNVAEFPVQSVVLVLWLGLITVSTDKLKLTFSGHDKLKLTKNNIITIIAATAVAALAIAAYAIYKTA